MTDFEIRCFALDLAVQLHSKSGNYASTVVCEAQQFEQYLQSANQNAKAVTSGWSTSLGSTGVSSPTVTGTAVTSGQIQTVPVNITYSVGAAKTTTLPTRLNPSQTKISFDMCDSVLDDLEKENFDLVEELNDYIAQFHRVVHCSDGTSIDINIDVPAYAQGVKKRGSISPQILITKRP